MSTRILALLLCLWPVAGCEALQATAYASAPARRMVVCGIDASRSYQRYVNEGRRYCTALMEQGQPGDEYVIRWITGESLVSEAFVGRYKMPAEARQVNPFDARERRRARLLQQQWTESIERVRSAPVPKSSRTDLEGFWASAAVALNGAAPDQERWIHVATDGVDTAPYGFDQGMYRLDGATVVLWITPGPDPRQALRLQNEWRDYLLGRGARAVEFLHAEISR